MDFERYQEMRRERHQSSRTRLLPARLLAFLAGTIGELIFAAATQPALASCSASGTLVPGTSGAPTIVTCDSSSAQSSRVGQGPGANYINVTVGANAQIVVPNDNSISLGNNASIVINSGALVQSTGNSGNGQYSDGPNTIDVNNNSSILIKAGASVITTNTQGTSEAINPYGAGNTIINYGLIQGGASTAIWFQNANTTASSPRNVVDNYGIIQVVRPGATGYDPTAQAIGASQWVGLDFINETGARVNGNLIFGSGNDTMTLNPGSAVTGNMDGGGGNNLITLNASATSSDSMPGYVTNFQTMNKTGAGTWILTGSVGNNGGSAPLAVTVFGGTLWLTGNNTNFNGTVLIDPAGTLEARAQSLPNPIGGQGVITDNGVLLINQVAPNATQTNDGTYTGSIVGTGVLTKIGIGTLTLTGVNTYSGGTNFNQGAIAVGADSALGATTGPLTFNGGALRLLASFDLSGARPIVLNGPNNGLPGGGTIDSNGFQTTISQGVTGAGGLTVADSTASTGNVILTGANTYAGGTTISSGTLQLGNGGASGSIVGNVADNGTLAFDRSDVSTFAGVVSGTGALTQIGSGTTILTAANTYSGGTTISAGTLQLGNGGTSGSIVGNVADNGDAGVRPLRRRDVSGNHFGNGRRQPDRDRHDHPGRGQSLWRPDGRRCWRARHWRRGASKCVPRLAAVP